MLLKTPSEKEELRHSVRAYLYDRPGTAHPIGAITRGLHRDAQRCDADDVEIALAFLVGAEMACESVDALGSTKYFQLTTTGTLCHERSGI